eukprot:TRINITY_DN4949_c0_g1_i1.p1 TRINITY_DN4949_c0_g1~~TRINITY_DN4949_c0_g1_i1.p1  ORF type:complete len:385 (+),score=80.49 TRINITY_DN4949_c0_g1_i1:143-1297(+)
MAFIRRETGSLRFSHTKPHENETEAYIRHRLEKVTTSESFTPYDATPASGDQFSSISQAVAINELQETEADYLAKLYELKELYYEPLMESKLVSPSRVEAIFLNLTTLIRNAEGVLRECSKSDPINAIVDMSLDVTVIPAFSYFCSRYQAALAAYQHLLSTNKQVAQLMQQPRLTSTGQPAQALETYLLEPIQRVPRYQLVIGNVYKNTRTEDPRHALIHAVLVAMQRLADEVNKHMAQFQTTELLAQIAGQFKDTATADLIADCSKLCMDLKDVLVRMQVSSGKAKMAKRGGQRRRCLVVEDMQHQRWLILSRRSTSLLDSGHGKQVAERVVQLSHFVRVGFASRMMVTLEPQHPQKEGYSLVVAGNDQFDTMVDALSADLEA